MKNFNRRSSHVVIKELKLSRSNSPLNSPATDFSPLTVLLWKEVAFFCNISWMLAQNSGSVFRGLVA